MFIRILVILLVSLFSVASISEAASSKKSSSKSSITKAAKVVTKKSVVKKAKPSYPQITKYLCYKARARDQVKVLQHGLNMAGYKAGPEDGIYGKQVQAAVSRLQKDLGLVADGVYVGYNSRTFLNKVLRGEKPKLPGRNLFEDAARVVAHGVDGEVHSTQYIAGEKKSDPDTDAGRTSTGVRVRLATAKQIGVCAGDPELFRQGSLVEVIRKGQKLYYILADVGSAVFSQTASRGRAPILDFYGKTEHKGKIRIIPYTGATPYLQLSGVEKLALLNLNNWKGGKFHSPRSVTLASL
jgi:peptidoglycan hydrolase-like protein with peptidoglycan-binding domain